MMTTLEGVPGLPEMREITLEDRALIEEAIGPEGSDGSEFTFTNLFVWRHAYQLQLSRLDGAVCIFAWKSDPEDSFLLPPLLAPDGADTVERALRHMEQNGHDPKLARASTAQLEKLGITGQRFTIEADRDSWDYVYRVRDLVDLPGNAYHDKRNHIAQFAAKDEFEYRPLTPDLAPACQELQDLWCDEKHCDMVSALRAEARAVKESLESLDELRAVGGCIVVEGKVQAFALGEPLSPDTVVIHIEKANPAFHGLYQVINQQFLEHEWQDYTYVNREQDLGVRGLRKAKESYNPHHMVEKHTVRLKG